MSGERAKKRRRAPGDCIGSRLLRQFACRRPASRLSSFTRTLCKTPRRPIPAPCDTAFAAHRCWCFRQTGTALTTSSCFSASQAHPGPPSYLSSPALRCNAPIPHDRCPLCSARLCRHRQHVRRLPQPPLGARAAALPARPLDCLPRRPAPFATPTTNVWL
jgi:hypothetical protein